MADINFDITKVTLDASKIMEFSVIANEKVVINYEF